MAETPRWRDLLAAWADGFGVVAGIVFVGGGVVFYTGILPWPIPLVPFTIGVTLAILCIIGKVFISNNEGHVTLGSLVGTDRNRRRPSMASVTPNLSASIDGENVPAHSDDNGVIVAGEAQTAEKTYRAYVISIKNTAPHKVKAAKRVRADIRFQDFYGGAQRIEKSAWLSEKETEIDLPPNLPPHRLILVTVEGDTVFSISRDLDTPYAGPYVNRQPLTRELYKAAVSLFTGTEPTPIKTLEYILEIKRSDGSLDVVLRSAYYWKLEHLSDFLSEGFEFLRLLNRIQRHATEKAKKTYEQGDGSLQRYLADTRVEEKNQEARHVEKINDWESRAAAFIGRHFGFTEKDKFVMSTPSIAAGFDRKGKTSAEISEDSSYWTLSDSVEVRVQKLRELQKGLPS